MAKGVNGVRTRVPMETAPCQRASCNNARVLRTVTTPVTS